MTNEKIRKAAAARGVHLWEIGEKFGLSDASFSRTLRHELTKEQTKQALKYVDEIANSRQAAGATK